MGIESLHGRDFIEARKEGKEEGRKMTTENGLREVLDRTNDYVVQKAYARLAETGLDIHHPDSQWTKEKFIRDYVDCYIVSRDDGRRQGIRMALKGAALKKLTEEGFTEGFQEAMKKSEEQAKTRIGLACLKQNHSIDGVGDLLELSEQELKELWALHRKNQ
jgi:hypothetical protein